MLPDPIVRMSAVRRHPRAADFKGHDQELDAVIAENLSNEPLGWRLIRQKSGEVSVRSERAEQFVSGQCPFECGQRGGVIGKRTWEMDGEDERAGHRVSGVMASVRLIMPAMMAPGEGQHP